MQDSVRTWFLPINAYLNVTTFFMCLFCHRRYWTLGTCSAAPVNAPVLIVSLLPRNAALLARSWKLILSVRPSYACFVTKPNNALEIFWYHTKGQSLYSFLTQQWLMGDAHFCLKFALKVTPFEKRWLRQISAHNVSTVSDSEKFNCDK